VGAGFTGLWAAFSLKRVRPDLRVVVLEREFAGFGASGRNGGWVLGEPAGSRERYAARHGKPAAIALTRAMFAAVDEVVDAAAAEGIDADIVKSGVLHVATNAAQLARLRAMVADDADWGWGPGDVMLLDPAESGARLRVAGARAWRGARTAPMFPDAASSRVGHAGGYTGHGVATANLAGRTLRDLVLRRDTELTALPWVGWRVRRWEPEPLRWLGVHLLYRLYRLADGREAGGLARTSKVARAADRVSGRLPAVRPRPGGGATGSKGCGAV
jgi:glycine/D-amino acid oxidase-like deaminating enzyme